jgi:hypothetical protein
VEIPRYAYQAGHRLKPELENLIAGVPIPTSHWGAAIARNFAMFRLQHNILNETKGRKVSQQRVSGISAHSSQPGRSAKGNSVSSCTDISALFRAVSDADGVVHSRYCGYRVSQRIENYFFQLLPPLEALSFVVPPFTFPLRCSGGRPFV